jgi:hypothetical protein
MAKKIEYHEGPEALENFKKLAGKIIQTPVEKQEKQPQKAASQKHEPKSDKD